MRQNLAGLRGSCHRLGMRGESYAEVYLERLAKASPSQMDCFEPPLCSNSQWDAYSRWPLVTDVAGGDAIASRRQVRDLSCKFTVVDLEAGVSTPLATEPSAARLKRWTIQTNPASATPKNVCQTHAVAGVRPKKICIELMARRYTLLSRRGLTAPGLRRIRLPGPSCRLAASPSRTCLADLVPS